MPVRNAQATPAVLGLILFAALSGASVTGLFVDSYASSEHVAMADFLVFDGLQRPSSPNHWLIAPADADPALEADAQAPVVPRSASALAAAWITVVEARPRTKILGVSEDGLRVEAEQRSAVFGFVDRISFRAVPVDRDRSSFFVFSRSQVGYWDVGVNRRRLDDWIGELLR